MFAVPDSNKPSEVSLTQERADKLYTQLEKLGKSKDSEDAERFKQIADEIATLQVTGKPGSDVKSQRALKLRLLLRTWLTLNARIDPLFDPDDVPELNVAPPEGAPFPAGVSPKAIKDPAIRQEYQAAIFRNKVKAKRYALQSELIKLRDRYPKERLFQFVQLNFNDKDKQAQEELDKLLREEVKDDNLRFRLVNKLAELAENYYVQPGGAIIERKP